MLCGLRVSFWDAWNRTDKEVAQLCGRTGLTKCAGLGAWKGKVVNFLLVKSTTIKKKISITQPWTWNKPQGLRDLASGSLDTGHDSGGGQRLADKAEVAGTPGSYSLGERHH